MSLSELEQHAEQTTKVLMEKLKEQTKRRLKEHGYKNETIERIIDFYTK